MKTTVIAHTQSRSMRYDALETYKSCQDGCDTERKGASVLQQCSYESNVRILRYSCNQMITIWSFLVLEVVQNMQHAALSYNKDSKIATRSRIKLRVAQHDYQNKIEDSLGLISGGIVHELGPACEVLVAARSEEMKALDRARSASHEASKSNS
eukprot:51783-Amphidinium_carterae.1